MSSRKTVKLRWLPVFESNLQSHCPFLDYLYHLVHKDPLIKIIKRLLHKTIPCCEYGCKIHCKLSGIIFFFTSCKMKLEQSHPWTIACQLVYQRLEAPCWKLSCMKNIIILKMEMYLRQNINFDSMVESVGFVSGLIFVSFHFSICAVWLTD